MIEYWLDIPHTNGRYQASSLGRVRSTNKILKGKPRVLKPNSRLRYDCVSVLSTKNKKQYVHILILETFIGPRPKGMESLHKNGNARDNRACNLRWGTSKENTDDAIRHGTHPVGEKHGCSIMTVRNVDLLRLRRKLGISYPALGREFNISKSQAHRICANQNWRTLAQGGQ